MIGSIGKLLANVSAPIAALFAIGYVAQVVNLWIVARQNYNVGYITAWHAASVIDRTVMIGIGLKYLVIFWPIAILLLAAYLKSRESAPAENPVPTSWTFVHGEPAPVFIRREEPPVRKEEKADGSSLWLGSVLLAVALAIAWLFIKGVFYPTPVVENPGDKEVLSYLPYVNMAVAGSTEEASSSVASEGQSFTGTAKPSNNGEEGTYSVTGAIDPMNSGSQDDSSAQPRRVEGVLLSHNSDYWYVFAEEGAEAGTTPRRILVIPTAKVSASCVVRANTYGQAETTTQGQDCTY